MPREYAAAPPATRAAAESRVQRLRRKIHDLERDKKRIPPDLTQRLSRALLERKAHHKRTPIPFAPPPPVMITEPSADPPPASSPLADAAEAPPLEIPMAVPPPVAEGPAPTMAADPANTPPPGSAPSPGPLAALAGQAYKGLLMRLSARARELGGPIHFDEPTIDALTQLAVLELAIIDSKATPRQIVLAAPLSMAVQNFALGKLQEQREKESAQGPGAVQSSSPTPKPTEPPRPTPTAPPPGPPRAGRMTTMDIFRESAAMGGMAA